MLPYHAYYNALENLDQESADWQSTISGLVVLRLINDWLDVGKSVIGDTQSFDTARALVQQIPDDSSLKPILDHTLRLLEHKEPQISHAIPPLLSYAEELQNHAEYDLTHDMLVPLLKRAKATQDSNLIAQVALKLACNARVSGRYDLSEECYVRGIREARSINNTHLIWNGHLGLSKLLGAQGDLSKADALCETVLTDAQRTGNVEYTSLALHDRAHMLSLRGDDDSAIPLLRRALTCRAVSEVEREYIKADLGACLTITGEIPASREINHKLVVSGIAREVRWQAAGNLMFAAIKEKSKEQFDLYRKALTLVNMPVLCAVQHQYDVAEGFRVFGNIAAAEAMHNKASALANDYGIDARSF